MSGAPSKCLLWFNGQKFDHCTCYGALGVNHDIPQDRLREKSLFRAQGEIFLRSLTFVRDDNSVFWTLRHSFSRGREERRSNSTASKTAPQNLYSFRPLDITGELVLVFPRIGHALAFPRPVNIESLDFRANKVRPGVCQRHLDSLTKRSDVLNGACARYAASSRHFLKFHFTPRGRRHPRLVFVASEIVSVVHDEDGQVFRIFIGHCSKDTEI